MGTDLLHIFVNYPLFMHESQAFRYTVTLKSRRGWTQIPAEDL